MDQVSPLRDATAISFIDGISFESEHQLANGETRVTENGQKNRVLRYTFF